MINYCKNLETLIMVLTSSTIMLPLSYSVAEAQNRIDPIVLRSAQSYCLEKGLSIVSEEFSTCLSDRIHALSSPAAVSEPESQPMPAPVSAPTPTIASEAAPAPDTFSSSLGELEAAGIEMYPASTLYGEKDPDLYWTGGKAPKHDLNIISIPSGVTVTIDYGIGDSFRRMICKTPCRVAIPPSRSFSIRAAPESKMYMASQVPFWSAGFVKGKFQPGTVVFKSLEGVETEFAKSEAECKSERKKEGTVNFVNCVAKKMEKISQ